MNVTETAIEACREGGSYLHQRFESGEIDAAFDEHDVKAAADRESEQRMLSVIQDAHPSHHVYAEESGDHPGESDYAWIVDPLDGTNNFTAGLPMFATVRECTERDSPSERAPRWRGTDSGLENPRLGAVRQNTTRSSSRRRNGARRVAAG